MAVVDARDHDVEAFEHRVRKIERAVAQDVALGAAQQADADASLDPRDLVPLSPQPVDVEVGGGSVRTPEGVLAGSLLTLDAAVRNLFAFTGCTVPEAVATVTSTPADMLGLEDRGRLQAGARADVTVLDRELRVLATIVGGEVAWRS